MEQRSKGVVVQIVLPIVESREEIDEIVQKSFADIRQTLYDVLEAQQRGEPSPSVIVRDFRIGGETQHYV